MPRKSRIRPKDLLKIINDSFERLNELSPLIPSKIINKFKVKYKTSTILRPPELNGLEEINIYTTSDTNEVRVNLESIIIEQEEQKVEF